MKITSERCVLFCLDTFYNLIHTFSRRNKFFTIHVHLQFCSHFSILKFWQLLSDYIFSAFQKPVAVSYRFFVFLVAPLAPMKFQAMSQLQNQQAQKQTQGSAASTGSLLYSSAKTLHLFSRATKKTSKHF